MIVGDPSIFAVESQITRAYARLSFRGLGFFVIHVAGRCYGVFDRDATMLACSFDAVERRIARRGLHTAPFATDPDAGKIAKAFRLAIYAPGQENTKFFGMPESDFRREIYANHLIWAPDGDEAFDDSSCVLHFDIEDRVRLIAFRSKAEGYGLVQETLRDLWLEADHFYRLLSQWHDKFEAEWAAMPKAVDET